MGIDSVQDLKQRGLSRSVLSDKAQNLPVSYIQANCVIGQYAGKSFCNIVSLQYILSPYNPFLCAYHPIK